MASSMLAFRMATWAPAVDLLAEADTTQDTSKYLDVDTTPIADTLQGTRALYVAAYATGVFALDARNGGRLWTNDKVLGVGDTYLWSEPAHRTAPGEPQIPARKLLLCSSGTSLTALDPEAQGRIAWQINLPDGGMTAPRPMMGGLLVGTPRHGMFFLSPKDGKVIDGIDPGTGFSQTPAVFGSRAFALSNGGALLGLKIETPVVAEVARPYGQLGVGPAQ
jgi:outer membrane protein assembly factor BamB